MNTYFKDSEIMFNFFYPGLKIHRKKGMKI
jgi:hypothetical protein